MNSCTHHVLCTGPVWGGGGRTLIWGCCRSSGPDAETRVKRIRSTKYLKILNDQVVPSVEFFFSDDVGRLQDDNFRILGAQLLGEWFRDADIISNMDGPPKSRV